jgi:hypothetical protein
MIGTGQLRLSATHSRVAQPQRKPQTAHSFPTDLHEYFVTCFGEAQNVFMTYIDAASSSNGLGNR